MDGDHVVLIRSFSSCREVATRAYDITARCHGNAGMSQTQLDDLTAGTGVEANVGLIANVLRNKGGEGRWESMRPLSAGVFGLEIATLSPQRERPITSSPVRSLPAAKAPPQPCGCGVGGLLEQNTPIHALRAVWSGVRDRAHHSIRAPASRQTEFSGGCRMGHSGDALSHKQAGDHWGCCHKGQSGLESWGGLLFLKRNSKSCCCTGT